MDSVAIRLRAPLTLYVLLLLDARKASWQMEEVTCRPHSPPSLITIRGVVAPQLPGKDLFTQVVDGQSTSKLMRWRKAVVATSAYS